MNEVTMTEKEITSKVLAIVCFGPATPATGFRGGEYFQVTIDPNACSPSGEYIRFGLHTRDEIHGWQRVAAMTVVEILGDTDDKLREGLTGYTVADNASIRMMTVE